MAKPTDPPTWASDDNYPAGAEAYAATPTKVVTTLAQQERGWEPGLKPPAQNMNAWQFNVAAWIAWLDERNTTARTTSIVPTLGNLNWLSFQLYSADAPYIYSTGGGGIYTLAIPVSVGDRITGLAYRAYGDGAADCTCKLFYAGDASGSGSVLGGSIGSTQIGTTITDTNRSAAWATNTMVIGTPHEMAATEFAFVEFNANANDYRVGRISWTIDRPND